MIASLVGIGMLQFCGMEAAAYDKLPKVQKIYQPKPRFSYDINSRKKKPPSIFDTVPTRVIASAVGILILSSVIGIESLCAMPPSANGQNDAILFCRNLI